MLLRQRIQLSVRTVIVSCIALVLLAGFYAPAASAQTANTLKVSPVRADIEVVAGTVKTHKVTVSNSTNEEIIVKPIINDFIAGDQSGTPAIILDENEYASTHSLKRFITPLSTITIPANKSVTVNVVITVPAGTQAGGYFGAVRFAPTEGDDGGQVNTSASVASLILMTVPGDIVETINLKSFEIKQNGKAGGNFGTSDGLQLGVSFENKGNVQIGPVGKISVKKGSDVVFEYDFNTRDPRDVVLPDSTRLWDIPLEGIDGFGYYEVYGTFNYGKKNQTIEVIKSFWVIPQWVIIAAIVALVILAGLIVGLIFLIRRKRGTRRYTPKYNGGGYRRR